MPTEILGERQRPPVLELTFGVPLKAEPVAMPNREAMVIDSLLGAHPARPRHGQHARKGSQRGSMWVPPHDSVGIRQGQRDGADPIAIATREGADEHLLLG